MLLHCRDEFDQRVALGGALGQPDVVVGHRLAVTLLELFGGALDECGGFVELSLQCVQMTCVSDEYRTGQTRVALVAALQGWQ